MEWAEVLELKSVLSLEFFVDDAVGVDCCAGSVVGVEVFFGMVVHLLFSCAVLQHLRQPNLGISVTRL